MQKYKAKNKLTTVIRFENIDPNFDGFYETVRMSRKELNDFMNNCDEIEIIDNVIRFIENITNSAYVFLEVKNDDIKINTDGDNV